MFAYASGSRKRAELLATALTFELDRNDVQPLRKILQRGYYGLACFRRARSRLLAAAFRLGWQIDHFVGYFAITSFFCVAWGRPLVVGAVFMVVAALLEALQSLTPDRSANLVAACYGAGGALAAAMFAEVVIRARRCRAG